MVKDVKLDEIKNLREDVGFHFTPKQNLESILETGLQPRIGSNSSGTLGQAAFPKVCVSYGLEGVLQLYNRILNIPFQGTLGHFLDDEHKFFLPKNILNNNKDYELSILEGFEYTRQLMENNVYLEFDAKMNEYENKISDEDIIQLNNEIKELEDDNGKNIKKRIKDLDERISELSIELSINSEDNRGDKKDELSKLIKERRELTIGVWKKTIEKVKAKQGSSKSDSQSCIIEPIDYNEEKLRWVNHQEHPHNARTKIVEIDGEIIGVPVSPDSLNIVLSSEGEIANGVQFLKEIYGQINENDKLNVQASNCYDVILLGYFKAYLDMVEKYKEEGLLVERQEQTIKKEDGTTIKYDSTLVVDLGNISKYEGLVEFGNEIGEFYAEQSEICKKNRKELKAREEGTYIVESEKIESKENANLSSRLAKVSAKDENVALISDEARDRVADLEYQPEKINDNIK